MVAYFLSIACVSVFVVIRNNWVFNQRVAFFNNALRNKDMEAYKRLPSYNVMVLKFWVWDVQKFLK